MPEKSIRFLIDTNLFVAAVKSGKTKSAELLVRLIEGIEELVADDILISEYERYALKFEALDFLKLTRNKVVIIEQIGRGSPQVQTIFSCRISGRCGPCFNLFACRSYLDL